MRIGHLADHLDPFVQSFLPALVLGWAVPEGLDDAGLTPWDDRRGGQYAGQDEPAWLVRFGHQHGGCACLQSEVGGLVLPLRGRPDAASVVASLDVLACDTPNDRPIHARPDLAPLHLTHGAPYDAAQLLVLRRALEPCPALPAPIGGSEALVELDASDAARRLLGWTVIRARLGETAAAPIRIEPMATLDDELLAAASAYAPAHPLRLFLVWFNSD